MSVDLEHTRERLREWARYFRDRARKGEAGSAERLWRSPQCWEAPAPRPVLDVQRAIRTQLLLQQLPHQYHRALGWRYTVPWLPLGIPLRALSRRLGYRVSPREYDELVAIGEHRLAVLLDAGRMHTPPRGRTSGDST